MEIIRMTKRTSLGQKASQIIDHGDHWHLYRGDKEVGVVTENPKSHYPDAEYINDSKDYSHGRSK